MVKNSLQSLVLVIAALLTLGSTAFAKVSNRECDGLRKSLSIDWTRAALKEFHKTDKLNFISVMHGFSTAKWNLVNPPESENEVIPVYRTSFSIPSAGEFATCKVYFVPQKETNYCDTATRMTCTKAYDEYSRTVKPYIDMAL